MQTAGWTCIQKHCSPRNSRMCLALGTAWTRRMQRLLQLSLLSSEHSARTWELCCRENHSMPRLILTSYLLTSSIVSVRWVRVLPLGGQHESSYSGRIHTQRTARNDSTRPEETQLHVLFGQAILHALALLATARQGLLEWSCHNQKTYAFRPQEVISHSIQIE